MSVAVTELSGAEVAVVTLAICNGFADYDALGRFLLMKLDVKLAVLVEPTGLEKAAGVVIDWAEETGATPRLLAMLRRDTDNAALQTVIDRHGIRIEDFSQVAAGSLAGMQAVAADPATRAAIARYRPEIARLCSLAVRLGGLKFLHDKVDGLRNQVYVPLAAIRARMPALDAEDQIDQYQRNMTGFVTAISAKVAEVAIPEDDVPWIEERLVPAQMKLAIASRNWPAEPEINAAVTWLNGVTGDNLAELNGMIKATAASIGELDFHAKLLAMKAETVTDAAVAASLADDIDRIDAGIVTMLARVAAHSRWQNIKDQLGDLIDARGRPIDESRFSWEILEKRLGKVEAPPAALAPAQASVAAAFAAADPRALRNAINDIRTIIDERFYSIDKELLSDAVYVSQLGTALQAVLVKIDG